MAITPTIANVITRPIGISNELAELLQFNSWEMENGSYNGVQFHIILNNANNVNPAAGIFNYLNGKTSTPPFGAASDSTAITDRVVRKLGIYRIPNSDFDEIEDYGLASPTITIIGMMTGINYSTILAQASKAFLDEPDDRTKPQDQQLGKLTGENFRVLNHPFFGLVNNVFLESWKLLHASSRFQSVFFELNLIPRKSTYLFNAPSTTAWQQAVQETLNASEATAVSILQTFSLTVGLTTNSFPFTTTPTALTVPLIDTQGGYIEFIENQIFLSLQNLSNIFTNSMAYFVQNSDGEIANSFYDTIEIDFSVLPVFVISEGIFSYSDAQSVITNYSTQVNQFITNANTNNYDFFLQSNILSLQTSVQQLDSVANQILLQNRKIRTVIVNKAQSLTEIIVQNGGSLNDFDDIAFLNNGNYFSATYIPVGSEVEIIV